MNKKVKVIQAFDAKHAASRSRVSFSAGDLLILIDSSEAEGQSRFMRINGLRPNRGVECQYLLDSTELASKTELVAK